MKAGDHHRPWSAWIDFLIIPTVVFFSIYTPRFASGVILSLDEGQHFAAINGLLRGLIPFRDIYFMHGPLLEYIPYWLMKAFGVNLGILRGFYLFGNILSLILAFILLRTLVSNPIIKYATIYFILRFPVEIVWINRWGGVRWVAGLVGLLCLYMWLRTEKNRYLFIIGVLCGAGLLVSQEIGFTLGVTTSLAVVLRAMQYSNEPPRVLRTIVADAWRLLAAFIVTVAPFFLFLLIHRAFEEYLTIQFVDTMVLLPKKIQYSPPATPVFDLLSFREGASLLTKRSAAYHTMMVGYFGMFVCFLISWRRNPDYRKIFLLSLICYGAILLKAAARGLPGPQFHAALPIAFITMAMVAELLLETRGHPEISERTSIEPKTLLGPERIRKVLVYSTIVVIVCLTGNPYSHARYRIAVLWQDFPKEAFVEAGGETMPRIKNIKLPLPQLERIRGVVEFLQTHTSPEDRIFTFPCEGHIEFIADRLSASRFSIAVYAKVRDEYISEVLHALEVNRPRFIVYLPGDYEILDIPNEERLRPIWAYIERNYRMLTRYGDMEIHVRAIP